MKSAGCCLVVWLAAGLFGGSGADPAEEAATAFATASLQFALDLLQIASKDSEENVLMSPSSIGVLLAIVQQGARENTAAQLEKILHLSAEDSKTGYAKVVSTLGGEKEDVTLEWGNRAFVVPRFPLKEEFLSSVKENFNGTFEELDWSESSTDAVTKINNWVKGTTRDKIRDLVDVSLLTSNVVMIMVNAIYFKSPWKNSFDEFKTRKGKFHVQENASVEVEFMSREGMFGAGEDAEIGVKWVELSFKAENFSMMFVLPVGGQELTLALEKLSGSALRQIMSNTTERQGKLTIPKFRLAEKVSLAKKLKELGLTDVFSADANLEGISEGEEPLWLSEVVHQAAVEIDERGSTAAAAAIQTFHTLSLVYRPEEFYFKANRPFLFIIVDKFNQVPMFVGKVANPKASVPE